MRDPSVIQTFENAMYNALNQLKEDVLVSEAVMPGTDVWVVLRDENGKAHGVAVAVYVASVSGFAITSDRKKEGIMDVMRHHMIETAEKCTSGMSVFPMEDCWLTKDTAYAALQDENGTVN